MSSSYEYAGFLYTIEGTGKSAIATAALGQHPAASKQAHLRAAVECWLQDGSPEFHRTTDDEEV